MNLSLRYRVSDSSITHSFRYINEYSTIARLNAPINRPSQPSKIDIPNQYIYCTLRWQLLLFLFFFPNKLCYTCKCIYQIRYRSKCKANKWSSQSYLKWKLTSKSLDNKYTYGTLKYSFGWKCKHNLKFGLKQICCNVSNVP